jgi:hypothetical protein
LSTGVAVAGCNKRKSIRTIRYSSTTVSSWRSTLLALRKNKLNEIGTSLVELYLF